jgi:hypothetical protein
VYVTSIVSVGVIALGKPNRLDAESVPPPAVFAIVVAAVPPPTIDAP